MGIKRIVLNVLNRSAEFKWLWYRKKISKKHKMLEGLHIKDKKKPIYYIIRYESPQSCGWTVYERVVLYSCIYATAHRMVPVVDMQSYTNIYQEEGEQGKVNTWENYYEQPAGITLKEALETENYVLADPSQGWFDYMRLRFPRRMTEEYLREQYSKWIHLRQDIVDICEENLKSIIPDENLYKNARIIAIRLRGTDYIKYNHSVQPTVEEVVKIAQEKYKEYRCDYYFLSTEDYSIFQKLKTLLPEEKSITFNAGNVKVSNGYVGAQLSKEEGARKASIDYLTTLYILNRCCCLVGGVCGATIVAKYRRNPAYEYINIIDFKRQY